MGVYSTLKHAAQYTTLSVALLAGVGAGHVSKKYESIDSKVQFQRQPREPCVLPAEHRESQKPFPVHGAAYFSLATLVVAYVANMNRKRADSFIVNRPDSPKNFFGEEEF